MGSSQEQLPYFAAVCVFVLTPMILEPLTAHVNTVVWASYNIASYHCEEWFFDLFDRDLNYVNVVTRQVKRYLV